MEKPRRSSLFSEREWNQISEALSLSPREREITRYVFHDLKEAAIARQLGISPHTVHTYLERIYRKLVVKSRVQMVVRVVREYLCLRSGHLAEITRDSVSTNRWPVDGYCKSGLADKWSARERTPS